MSNKSATVTSKGQLVIPVELRRKHRIRAGTKVAIFEDPLGRIVLQPITEDYVDKLMGCLEGSDMLQDWEREHRIEGEKDEF